MSQPATAPLACAALALFSSLSPCMAADFPACANPVYLTVDPGNMDFAPRIASVLRRQQVPVTYWVSNQSTRNGEGSLGYQWGGWWKLIAKEGHEFASQTYDQVYWRGDLPGYKPTYRILHTAGALAGREFTYEPARYCEQIEHAAHRMEDHIGRKALPVFHPPGGSASPRLLATANACGYLQVGFASSTPVDAKVPLKGVLAGIHGGDVVLVDLHAAPNQEPWAMANLEPLIVGLKERGFCFASLRQHPAYKDWIGSHGG